MSDVSAPRDPLDVELVVSEEEHIKGQLSPDNVRLGTLLLHTRGYVILTGAVPDPLLGHLRSSFAQLFEHSLAYVAAGVRQTPPTDQAGNDCVFWKQGARFRIFPS